MGRGPFAAHSSTAPSPEKRTGHRGASCAARVARCHRTGHGEHWRCHAGTARNTGSTVPPQRAKKAKNGGDKTSETAKAELSLADNSAPEPKHDTRAGAWSRCCARRIGRRERAQEERKNHHAVTTWNHVTQSPPSPTWESASARGGSDGLDGRKPAWPSQSHAGSAEHPAR